MKKIIGMIVGTVLILSALYFFGSGFIKIGSVYIGEYSISPDGTEITMNVGVGSSAGFVRKVAVHQQQDGKLYLDCYSAFGGFNGSVGSKSEYTIPLNDDTEMIAIYRSSDCYEEVLRKDSNGDWQSVQ